MNANTRSIAAEYEDAIGRIAGTALCRKVGISA